MKREEVLKLDDSKIDKLIKLQGTEFDRRRKLSNKDILNIRKLFGRGTSISAIAEKYKVAYTTVMYHLSDMNKYSMNALRTKYGYNAQTADKKQERIDYKRKLVESKKYKTNKI